MIVFFNTLGFAWLVLAILIAILLQTLRIYITPEGEHFVEIFFGSIFVLDILYRLLLGRRRFTSEFNGLKTNVLEHWLLGPKLGGSLMFLPAWATGIIGYVWLVFIVGFKVGQ